MDLKKVANELRQILDRKRENFQLSFEEETHKYTMLDLDGDLKSDFPSVSKVMKLFYDEFPADKKAFEMAGGDQHHPQPARLGRLPGRQGSAIRAALHRVGGAAAGR